jgi:hypothetical protein
MTISKKRVLLLQGVYYVVSGAWAVLHRRSFEWVSGGKTDYWLVRTVGGLAVSIGTALCVAAAREQEPTRESTALSVGSATAFGVVDVVYAVPGRIRRVYLLDLAVEAGFLWLLFRSRRRDQSMRETEDRQTQEH